MTEMINEVFREELRKIQGSLGIKHAQVKKEIGRLV
jgi:hypothetical protein